MNRAQASRCFIRYIDRERCALSVEFRCLDAGELEMLGRLVEEAEAEGYGMRLSLFCWREGKKAA